MKFCFSFLFSLVLAQAIESMSRAPPPTLATAQSEQTQQQSSQSEPILSILQRAIQQSDLQFNTNPTSSSILNGSFDGSAPFQPFDLDNPNLYSDFQPGPALSQITSPQQQQSPLQTNNIRFGSPQTMSSPLASHSSPTTQTQTTPQQTNSPRASGGSTLQFVPSQVLRKMSKKP